MLFKHPTFAIAVIVTLALGVGANTAVFSVVNSIVLRPLPVRAGDRLVVIASHRTSDSDRALRGVSFADLQDYPSATVDVFEDIAGYSVGFVGLASRTQPRTCARHLDHRQPIFLCSMSGRRWDV